MGDYRDRARICRRRWKSTSRSGGGNRRRGLIIGMSISSRPQVGKTDRVREEEEENRGQQTREVIEGGDESA